VLVQDPADGPVLVWPSPEAPSRVSEVVLASCWPESPGTCRSSSSGVAVSAQGSNACAGRKWMARAQPPLAPAGAPLARQGWQREQSGVCRGPQQGQWMRWWGGRPRWMCQGCLRGLVWGRESLLGRQRGWGHRGSGRRPPASRLAALYPACGCPWLSPTARSQRSPPSLDGTRTGGSGGARAGPANCLASLGAGRSSQDSWAPLPKRTIPGHP